MIMIEDASPRRPKVSVVIATWLPENKNYLDLCVESVKNSDYPQDRIEIIVVGKPSYLPQYEGVSTISPAKDHFYCSEGMNYGVSQAKDCKYILLLNDDVVLTKECLSRLVNTSQAGQDQMMVAPISNTDNDLQFTLFFGYEKNGKWTEIPKHWIRYEDVKGDIPALLSAKSMYNCGVIWTDHICMSSPLIPSLLWDKVGGFDETFHGGPDDIDFCIRAAKAGYRLAISLDALAWHFGSVTIGKTVTTDTWLYNIDLFIKKHGGFPVYVNQEKYDMVWEQHKLGQKKVYL